MTDIILIRHGLTDANTNGLIMGRSKDPLNTEGKAQVRRIAKFLKETEFNAIYVSPSKRALQTAQLIMRGRDAIPLIEESRVDEINFGEWVGKNISEIRSSDGFNAYLYHPSEFTPPGGEPISDVPNRAAGAIENILSANAGQRIAVISHADVIKSILVHYLNMPLDAWQNFKIDNASVSMLRFTDGKKPKAMVINCHGDMGRYCK